MSKKDIKNHCMMLWLNSEKTWEHYLAAKKYEKLLSKFNKLV